MQLKHNIFKMYLLKGVLWFMVSMPIIVLFFQEHGLSLTQVMLLQAIYSLSVALFEIPSGYIADVFGRRKTIILSTIFCFMGYLIFSFYGGFYAFAIAEILVGIGGSLMSGSDSAIIYDTLLETEDEESYTKIEGRNYAIGNFSEALAGILGGLLAVSSIYLPVYVQTAILFLSIPIAFSLVEPKIHADNKLGRSFKAIFDVVNFALVDNMKLRWLIIYSSAMGIATLSMAWFAQPFFKQINIPLAYFGVLWAGLNFSAGITSFNSYRLDRGGNKKLLIFLSLAMVFSFLLLGINSSVIGLLFVLFIYLLRGVVTPILRNAINVNTTSDKRATVLSIRSFIIRISFVVSAPFFGYLADNHSLSYTFYALSIIVGFFSILSAIKLIRLDNKSTFV
ncbi:MAG: MFS transporter [Flavobacteriales bacterium]|nr:MFS transporter [Flavobacteriales bacterium]|tara:strand:+ start:5638 stop:6819 length:1182 start_codon:yes stop_codon:yes gene_type:complete